MIKKIHLLFCDGYVILSKCHAGVAELADAPDLGSGGRPWGFESLHPHKALFYGHLRKILWRNPEDFLCFDSNVGISAGK